MHLSQALAVMAGGALGALTRYATSLYFTQYKASGFFAYPVATLCVNVLGCFLLSLLVFSNSSQLSPTVRLALGTGFLGALTTFSTFELELFQIGDLLGWLQALAYFLVSVGLGFSAILLGRWLGLILNG